MKLTYDDKDLIYELRKHEEIFKQISNQFGVSVPGLQYKVRLIDCYVIEIVKTDRLLR